MDSILRPLPEKGREKNRLTHERFLHAYQQIMKPGGIINLKTDSKVLYDFTLEVIVEQNCTIHQEYTGYTWARQSYRAAGHTDLL